MSDYVFRQNINCGKDTIGCKEIRIPNEVVNQIRAEVIEECIAKIGREHTHSAYNDDVYEAIMLLEQLKESEEV